MTERRKNIHRLMTATLILILVSLGSNAMTQEVADLSASVTPVVHLKEHPVTPPEVETHTPAPRIHQLKGVRLQPLAKAMRLILMFDRPTAYAIRQDLQHDRIYLDLINTRIDFLSADLHRIEDPRLGGVWLKHTGPGLTTLELRLSSPNVSIEHFSMDDPSAIVVDLTRTDHDWATIPHIQARTIPVESSLDEPVQSDDTHTTTTSPVETTRPKPVVPLDQLTLTEENPQAVVPPQIGATPEATATPEPVATPHSEAMAQAEDAPSSGGQQADTIHSGDQQLVSSNHVSSEIKPLNAEYDYFPIDAINMTSPLGEEIMDDFLYRRWGSVLSKGLHYLELNPVNEETAYLLYLMAEARWQMAAEQNRPEVIHDMQNFYLQALRVYGSGELSRFAHWRLGQIDVKLHDLAGAVSHMNEASQSRDHNVMVRSQMTKARVLIELQRPDEAHELLQSLNPKLNDNREELTCELLSGEALVMQDKYEQAWECFANADGLYRDWEAIQPDAAEMKAKAALHMGNYQLARDILENISINYPYRDQNKRVRAGLLYLEVLARLGDIIKAEQFYYEIFHNLEGTLRGREILDELYRLHPEELLEGQGHYCKLLLRQGKIREAMTELDRANNQCLKEGVSTRGLESVIQVVVPAYMEQACRTGNNYDIVQIWWLYGRQINDIDIRLKCQDMLAQAYENLGLYDEALNLNRQLAKVLPSASLPSPVTMNLRQSRLLIKTGHVRVAIPELERLVTEAHDGPMLQEVYSLLAESYADSGRDLEAAQAWQTLSQTPNLPPEQLGLALVNAGEVFLDHQMTTQTLELGLKGLIYEKELAERALASSEAAAGDLWGNDSGQRLRTILGQTYFERGDYGRAIIVLGDLLARSDLPEEERCKVTMQVADCHRRLGRNQQALQLYEGLADSDRTPQVWRKTASQWRDNIRWNMDNPNWKIPTVGVINQAY